MGNAQKLGEKSTGSNYFIIVKSIICIILLATSLFVFISLISFNYADGGWSHTGFNSEISNSTGLVGAYVADLLIYFFGMSSYYFPFITAYIFHFLVRGNNPFENKTYALVAIIRIVGLIIVIAASSALLDILNILYYYYSPYSIGGIIGSQISYYTIGLFNRFGAIFVIFTLFLCGLTMLFKINWLTVCISVYKKTLDASKLIYKYIFTLVQFIFLKYNNYKLKKIDEYKDKVLKKLDQNQHIISQEIIKKQNNKLDDIDNKNFKKKKEEMSKENINQKKHKINIKVSRNNNKLPSVKLLDKIEESKQSISSEVLENLSLEVEKIFKYFNLEVKVVSAHYGPIITRLELQLTPGLKISKITSIEKDIARSLSITSVRIVEVIPGKPVIGLEVPNENRKIIKLYEILSSQIYKDNKFNIPLAIGQDIAGNVIVKELTKMPHLLVAGTTGSGKSVVLNSFILSILFNCTPNETRLILIDPKMLEFSLYDGIPHLLTPVITDMNYASSALRWCVKEMDYRYRIMSALGVRNIDGYNNLLETSKEPVQNPYTTEEQFLNKLPYIVIIIDEFADMMMLAGKKVEHLIVRLAQKARASGIHMILATQRPSVDVITGLIKSNIPTRISLSVSSKIDSRTVIDQSGAEQLLGNGDMLCLESGTNVLQRLHGAYVSDNEVHRTVETYKYYNKEDLLCYKNDILAENISEDKIDSYEIESTENIDELYDHAIRFVTETRKASVSSIQRKFKIGYNRAARIVEEMESKGVVSSMGTNGVREVLAPKPKTVSL